MQERICKTHFWPIIAQDNKNQYQCEACLENEYINKMLKIEKVIQISKEILNQQKEENKVMSKTVDLILKYKSDLPLSFNERKGQYKYQFQQSKIFLEEHKYKKFNYQLINEYTGMWKCFSFVFNFDSTLLFIGQLEDIKVYEFNNGEIKNEQQILKQHTQQIHCLIYMNKSDLLVSGSEDNTLIIWNQDQNDNWKLQQILEGHKDSIRCLINNEDENLIISGSNDYTIKFWRKINMNWNCQQTIKTESFIMNLSLSPSQTKLISCGYGWSKQILIMEQNPDQQWIVSQKIKTNTDDQHLLFISDNQFVSQNQSNYLEIYLYDQNKKQYVKDKQINLEIHDNLYFNGYPFFCKHIEERNILLIPQGSYLNCFRIDQEQNYIFQQSFFYVFSFLYNVSNDGQYLITYNRLDKIEIRKLQYIE